MPSLCHKPETSVLNLVFWAVFLKLRCSVSLIPSEILCQTHGTLCKCSRLHMWTTEWSTMILEQTKNKALALHGPLEVVSASLLLPDPGNITFICLSLRFCIFSLGLMLRDTCYWVSLNKLCRWNPWVKDGSSCKQQECCGCAEGTTCFWFGFLVSSGVFW